MSQRQVFSFAFIALVAVFGCGDGQQEWHVKVQNFSKEPVDIAVTLGADGKSTAEVKQYHSNADKTIISGKGATIVNTVTVVQSKEKKVQTVNEKLPGGKDYFIVIESDGTVTTSIR